MDSTSNQERQQNENQNKIRSSSCTGGGGKVALSHRIPHRFVSRQIVTPHHCIVCKKMIWPWNTSVVKCSDCNQYCHSKCTSLAPPNCGLSVEMLQNAISLTDQPISMTSNSGDASAKAANQITPISTVSPSTSISKVSINTGNESDVESIFAAPVLSHQFLPRQFPKPRPCKICDKPIWGIAINGLNCAGCGTDLHKHCFAEYEQGLHRHISQCSSTPSSNSADKSKESFESTFQLNYSEDDSIAIFNNQSLERRRDKTFRSDTLLRLTRRKYQIPKVSDIFPSQTPQPERNQLEPISSTDQYRRRSHPFRGHEFLATYLNDDEASTLNHTCQVCSKQLGDGGRQCYQCKFCKFISHRKCYTLTKPCEITFGAFAKIEDEPTTQKCATNDQQATMIQYRNSMRLSKRFSLTDNPEFVEDFSEELVRVVRGQKSLQFLSELDDYVIGEKILGSGQYGVVKAGHYKHNPDQKFALKVVDKKRFWTPKSPTTAAVKLDKEQKNDMPTILRRELDILKKLDHPGIVRMHHFIDTSTQTLIIMDLAPDGDLLDYIMKHSRVAEPEMKHITQQILQALKYLHDNGIVHRDLKPENLLLTNQPDGRKRVQIADFGFATVMERFSGISVSNSAFMQSVVGTPAYMSPEIVDKRVWSLVRRKKQTAPSQTVVGDSKSEIVIPDTNQGYTKSADMWSLGVVLYVSLGGVFPFDSQKPILDQILTGEFFFPDEYFRDVSDEAIDFICCLLSVDPSCRPDCSKALNHSWFQTKS